MNPVRSSTKVISGVAGVSAAALSIGLLAFAPGVGASFTDGGTATANINVGTLKCNVSTNAAGATTSGNSVTFNLPTITSSLPGQETAPVTVTNAGNIPMNVSWNVATSGPFFASAWQHTYYPVMQNAGIAASGSATYNVGVKWSNDLTNADMGPAAGQVVYTANCSDQPAAIWFSDNAGGTHEWLNSGGFQMTVPAATASAFGGDAAHIMQAVGQPLPAQQPKFTSTFTPSPAGALRLSMLLSNGNRVIVNSDGTLDNGGPTTWSEDLAAVGENNVANSAATVVDASLIADTSMAAGFTTDITCINYNGTTPLFGSC